MRYDFFDVILVCRDFCKDKGVVMNLFKLLLVAGLSLQVTVLSMMAMEKDPEFVESEYDLCSLNQSFSDLGNDGEEGGLVFTGGLESRPLSVFPTDTKPVVAQQEEKVYVSPDKCTSPSTYASSVARIW